MRAYAIALALMLPVPAAAHAILSFDHATPPVGSTVDGAPYIALWFQDQIAPDDIEIRLRNGQAVIQLRSLLSGGGATRVIAAEPHSKLPPGVYSVDWRDRHEGDFWHTYHFTVRP